MSTSSDPLLNSTPRRTLVAAASPRPQEMVSFAFVWGFVKEGLFTHWWGYRHKLLTNEYEECEKLETPEKRESLLESRMKSYQQLILFGLGSAFWAVASSVVQKKLSRLGSIEILYSSLRLDLAVCFLVYCSLSVGAMLCGLVASTFHRSSLLAPCVAGAGAWISVMFVLITAHLGSLNLHDELNYCLWSIGVWATVITLYWSYSVQDPKPLYVTVKTVVWILWGSAFVICSFVAIIICLLVKLVIDMWSFIRGSFMRGRWLWRWREP